MATGVIASASKNYTNHSKHMTVFSGRDNVNRSKLLGKWKRNGGVMLIGYTAFRNLSTGRTVKDRTVRENLCLTLQVNFL